MAALRSHLVVLTLLGALTWGARAQADDPAPAAPPQGPVPAPAPTELPSGLRPGGPGAPPPGVPPQPVAPKPVLAFPNDALIERADGKVVYFYRTNFVTPGDLEKSIALMNLTGVTFKPFPTQNQLLVEGPPEAVEVALDALAYFDIATPQVFIEAKVVELTSDSNFEYGLDYALDRNVSGSDTFWRGINGFLSPPSLIASTLPGGLPFQGTNLLFGLIPGAGGSNTALKFGAFEMTLQALQENGKAEILSKPSIICTQGVLAEVITSESFSENRLDTSNRNTFIAGTADAPVVQETTAEAYKAQPASTGVELRVTAKHIGENFVTIDIFPKVMGLAGSGTRLGGTNAQITTIRSAKTMVTLADGETLVIGGLYTNRLVKGEARTPLLSDLPLVGSLFTRQHETKQKTELIFILTPRIIRKNVDARVILPPAELERLEQSAGDGKCDHCGPCTPMNSMEDALYPRGAACRRQQQRAAARASAESSSSPPSSGPPYSGPPPSGPPPSGPPSGPPSASSRPPPPPPPPPEPPAPPAQVRTR